MTISTPGNYIVSVAEKRGPIEREEIFLISNETSTHNITSLKPCTEYELNVTFRDLNGTEIFCDKTENKTTKTTGLSE